MLRYYGESGVCFRPTRVIDDRRLSGIVINTLGIRSQFQSLKIRSFCMICQILWGEFSLPTLPIELISRNSAVCANAQRRFGEKGMINIAVKRQRLK